MAFDYVHMEYLIDCVMYDLEFIKLEFKRPQLKKFLQDFKDSFDEAIDYASIHNTPIKYFEEMHNLESKAKHAYATKYLKTGSSIVYVLDRAESRHFPVPDFELHDILAQISMLFDNERKGLPVLNKERPKFGEILDKLQKGHLIKKQNGNFFITVKGIMAISDLCLQNLIDHNDFNRGIDQILNEYAKRDPQPL